MCFPYRYEDRIQVRVGATAEETWKLVASLERVPEWDPHTISSKKDGENVWTLTFKRWEPMFYCVRFSMPNTHVRFVSHNLSRTLHTDESFHLSASKGEGTVITYTFVLRAYGWRSLFAWRFVPQLREEMDDVGHRLLQKFGTPALQL